MISTEISFQHSVYLYNSPKHNFPFCDQRIWITIVAAYMMTLAMIYIYSFLGTYSATASNFGRGRRHKDPTTFETIAIYGFHSMHLLAVFVL